MPSLLSSAAEVGHPPAADVDVLHVRERLAREGSRDAQRVQRRRSVGSVRQPGHVLADRGRFPVRVSMSCPEAAPAGVFSATGCRLAWYEVPVDAEAMPGIANIAIPMATVGAARSADLFRCLPDAAAGLDRPGLDRRSSIGPFEHHEL